MDDLYLPVPVAKSVYIVSIITFDAASATSLIIFCCLSHTWQMSEGLLIAQQCPSHSLQQIHRSGIQECYFLCNRIAVSEYGIARVLC